MIPQELPQSLRELRRPIKLLSDRDRKKITIIVVIQFLMSLLDLIGVGLVGLLSSLAISGENSKNLTPMVSSGLHALRLSGIPFREQVGILAMGAVILFTTRTFLSIFFTRRILFFLSHRGAQISSNLILRVLSQPLLEVLERTTQETLFAITRGVEIIFIQVIATSIVLVSDVSLLLVLSIGLFIVDPTTAIGTFTIFSVVALLLNQFMYARANILGRKYAELEVTSNEKIAEVIASYRELVVGNRRQFYSRFIGNLRSLLADTSAELYFMPYVSKYVIETTVVIGGILIAGSEFILKDISHALITLALFMAAGSRIAPAVLRVQQGFTSIRANIGQAKPTLDLMDKLQGIEVLVNIEDKIDFEHNEFKPEIEIKDISFTYPGATVHAIANLTLRIPTGSSVAIIGPSGAGKTTLVDIILGLISPDEGFVSISGYAPLTAMNKWPGAIAYLPQDVMVAAGTIRENVALGYPPEVATDEFIMRALKFANLEALVLDLPSGMDTPVGENGAKLSGGQRQRLGIARAIFTQPGLIVLDEATSALDNETEESISNSLNALRGRTTSIIIAHRLSTVKEADIVIYLSHGKVLAIGTYTEVCKVFPESKLSSKLMIF